MPAAPSARARPLHFTASVVRNPTGDANQGYSRRPSARQADFDHLEHQVRLARTLERGKFDAVFFVDAAGLRTRWRRAERGHPEGDSGSPDSDPSVLAGAISYVTSHLGIAFTSSILQEDPLSFARRVSTLDHTSGGRIAGNIADDPPGAWTEEYVDVTYKLWEGSWDEDALHQDGKVHRINHQGPRYKVTGPHPVSPSPQRTPLLFRTAASEADRTFAARNAEAVFLQSPTPHAARNDIADIRSRAASHGREPGDIKFFQQLLVITGSTEAEARRKAAELDEQAVAAPSSSGPAAGGRIAGTPDQIAMSWRSGRTPPPTGSTW